MIRVLNLVHQLNCGGIERYLLRLISHMDRTKWHMDVLCKGGLGEELLAEYERVGVEVLECPQSYYNPVSWLELRRIIKRGKYDVVCDFTGDFAGIPLLMALTSGVSKRIAWYRDARPEYKPGIRTIYAWGVRSLVKACATDILSNSLANLAAYHPNRRKNDLRYEVIANGVPPDVFCPNDEDRALIRKQLDLSESDTVIGHVGGFRPPKNHAGFIRVAALIRQENVNAKFVLVGDGSLREEIERQIDATGLKHCFKLLGNRSDVCNLLRAMDVFLFPSFSEGMPNALIEAMLSGVPFVASNIPSILETTPDWTHCWLSDPTDYVGMARKVSTVLESSSKDCCERTREWASRRYSMIGTLDRYYDRLKPGNLAGASNYPDRGRE